MLKVMVCDITYLVTLNCLTLYFMSILKVEKAVNLVIL